MVFVRECLRLGKFAIQIPLPWPMLNKEVRPLQFMSCLSWLFEFAYLALDLSNFYRPQTKFANVMFSHVSVCPWGEGGVCPIACWDTPPDQMQTPPGSRQPPPGPDTPSPRADTPHCSVCWEIRATSGQYASYRNAFL